MARSIWKGVISFGMVTIPVRLLPATQDKDVAFHLLHKTDHSRIKLKKWCPVDDREVGPDELVRAFEVSKDEYVELTDEDLDQLPLPSKHTIELSAFVDARDIDPIYYEKTYYLEPEEAGLKPYALLVKALADKNMTGMATIAIRNKEQLCALRAADGGLLVDTLFYPDEIRQRDEDPPQMMINDRELAMASSLVDALSEPFDPSKYQDGYREAVLALIESKTQGHEVVAPESDAEAPQVGDLMSALRASIEAARKRKNAGAAAAPAPARATSGASGASRASGASEAAAPAKATRSRERSSSSKATRARKKAAA